jgi:hypothetical protein
LSNSNSCARLKARPEIGSASTVIDRPSSVATAATSPRCVAGSPQRIVLSLAAAAFSAACATAGETPSSPDAKVYFVNLRNGDVVTSPFAVKFGLAGMVLVSAGEQKPNTGHHHRAAVDHRVDDEDERQVRFGKGQTETTLTLAKGTHMLQLVLGDWTHVPHNPPVMSERITLTVK